jgi:biotin carboxylase
MNLLITNTRNPQAYAIIRALRPYATKIVATMEGNNRVAARLSHAANSRLVDKRYYSPSPATDWRAGRIQKENTAREEAYVRAVMRICEEEKIDTIFPSFDPHVYVFSKNKEKFEKLGVLIPVPDYETVIVPLDKYRTIRAAQEVGFPCPRTRLPETEDDLWRIAEELGFPLVIKPRFNSAGRGTYFVTDFRQLLEKIRLLNESQSLPMIQEYIPGKERESIFITLDKKGDVKAAICTKASHTYVSVGPNFSLAAELVAPCAHTSDATRLVKKVGWWGGVTVQTKIDCRDDIPRLMEINPRLGIRLWHRTEIGINEPLMCLKIAQGKKLDAVDDYAVSRVYLDPIEDLLGLALRFVDLLVYRFRIGVQKQTPVDPLNPPMGVKQLIRSHKNSYLNGKKKTVNPYFRYFFQDPLVSVLWWFQFSLLALRSANQLGR